METLIYLDSNIWIDLWEDRRDNIRPLGEFAFQLLKMVYECKFRVVLSGAVLNELLNIYPKKITNNILRELYESEKYVKIVAEKADVVKAEIISEKRSLPYSDVLHAVLANKANARYLVTRNIVHFEALEDLAEPKMPEELL